MAKRQQPTFEELYKAASVLREKRLKMAEKFERERIEKEMSEATFKPKLNKHND
jgi:Fe-S cluster biosynthesis and repair protein YggX